MTLFARRGSFEAGHAWNVRWLKGARRVLKPDGTLWVCGTHHVVFSLGFALQSLGFRIINQPAWQKPDPVPNALHTAFARAKAVAIRAPSAYEPQPRLTSSRTRNGTDAVVLVGVRPYPRGREQRPPAGAPRVCPSNFAPVFESASVGRLGAS